MSITQKSEIQTFMTETLLKNKIAGMKKLLTT